MKRIFDITISLTGLILISPVLIIFMLLIYFQDKSSPLYIAPRVGKNKKIFNIIKLRSMTVIADKSGVNSTSINDSRITEIGHVIRKYKLDELTQLWNVLIGDMSLVGPRPNVLTDVNLYTNFENQLLTVKPGITDFSSIVFSDEGNILKNSKNPNLDYNQLIRPWKSRLGLIYINHMSILLDIQIIIYTLIALISKRTALNWISKKLEIFGVEKILIDVSKRNKELFQYPPLSSDKIT